MTKRLRVAGVLMFFVTGFLGTLAFGQDLVTDIKFPFRAGSDSLPAGKYKIQAGDVNLTIRNMDTGATIKVPFLTRLSSREGKPELVFDKEGETFFLSEIYMAATDGYHLQGAPGKHTHVKVETK